MYTCIYHSAHPKKTFCDTVNIQQTEIIESTDSNVVVTLVGLDAYQGYSISVLTSNAAGQGQAESIELERGKKLLTFIIKNNFLLKKVNFIAWCSVHRITFFISDKKD